MTLGLKYFKISLSYLWNAFGNGVVILCMVKYVLSVQLLLVFNSISFLSNSFIRYKVILLNILYYFMHFHFFCLKKIKNPVALFFLVLLLLPFLHLILVWNDFNIDCTYFYWNVNSVFIFISFTAKVKNFPISKML